MDDGLVVDGFQPPLAACLLDVEKLSELDCYLGRDGEEEVGGLAASTGHEKKYCELALQTVAVIVVMDDHYRAWE